MIFTQVSKHLSGFIQEFLDIHQLQSGLQEWIHKEIVDDDPYEQETSFPDLARFSSANNRKEHLVSIRTKVSALISVSELTKIVVIKEFKKLQAHNSLSASKRVYQ